MAKGRKTGGRQSGSLNKTTADVKEMILGALNAGDGGQKYLEQQKAANPVAFMSLLGKLIPRDLHVSGEVKHTLEQTITASYEQHPRALDVPASSVTH